MRSTEDYLTTIFRLEKDTGARCTDISRCLNITKAGVSKLIKKMKAEGFVRNDPYSDIMLTEKGRKAAERVLFRHRVVEVFLVDALGLEPEDVHEEAHVLEHAFSDKVIRRLYDYMEKPKACPHGSRIGVR